MLNLHVHLLEYPNGSVRPMLRNFLTFFHSVEENNVKSNAMWESMLNIANAKETEKIGGS